METRTLRLDFPIERVGEPVVTKLVTEFDVEPNVLSANIDPDLAPRPALKVLLAGIGALLLVAAWRYSTVLKRLWTKRYIQKTIPTS